MAVPVTELEIKNKQLEVAEMRQKEYIKQISKWTEKVRNLEKRVKEQDEEHEKFQ
jgi:hypothetical protein